ncbi:MAG: cobalamin B12-binding domain-containing protein [Myxococcaceae bacterium]
MRPSLSALQDHFASALLRGDRAEAVRLVVEEGLARGAAPMDLLLEVIARAQREVGALWEANRIGVAQEHRATAITQGVLTHLFSRVPRPPPAGHKAVVACAEGELHGLPARMVAGALELSGFRVEYLGADVPTSSLLSFVESERPQLVALSATMVGVLPQVWEALHELRERLGRGVLIGIGGAAVEGLSRASIEESGADFTHRDARGAAHTALELLRR